jgi:hypothetical protein
VPATLGRARTPTDAPRAGLGVSLLASEPTLVERVGNEEMDATLRVDTALAAHLWRNANDVTQ